MRFGHVVTRVLMINPNIQLRELNYAQGLLDDAPEIV